MYYTVVFSESNIFIKGGGYSVELFWVEIFVLVSFEVEAPCPSVKH